MSALRMCAYGVLILPRLRDERGRPLKQPLGAILMERAKIIEAVSEELETELPGWAIAPFGPRTGRWRKRSSTGQWYTELFIVYPPPISSGFGELQPLLVDYDGVSWRQACMAILRIIEPDNTAWV